MIETGGWIELSMEDLEGFLERAKDSLSEEDHKIAEALVSSIVYVTRLAEDKGVTAEELRQLLLGQKTEKTREVLKQPTEKSQRSKEKRKAKDKVKGHGRHGAEAYRSAEKIVVTHPSLRAGDSCPDCHEGTVYERKPPGVLVRVVGQPPLRSTVYELQKLRCNLCGRVFTADPPEGVGRKKYDATSAAMLALLRYGTGLPFNRLEGLQRSLGTPLPASTQWDIAEGAAEDIWPVYEELVAQAAQGMVVHNDDTFMRVLSLMKENEERDPSRERTGVFTSGIVSTAEGRKVALFFTGRQHAGENLRDVLAHRASELSAPIQMCDALSRNLPKELEVIVGNCLVHGRRKFVEVVSSFPEECRHVLETVGEVYHNEAWAKQQKLSPSERLKLHQRKSGPVMDELHGWLTGKLERRDVEPNSGLGRAISYMLKHWEKLTLFLREPGAPIDNNICERGLKKAILHRKNSLFYRTENGAHVGDLFMSLIHTCELSEADPFDYLTQLLQHTTAISKDPKLWMPWNYRETLAAQKDL